MDILWKWKLYVVCDEKKENVKTFNGLLDHTFEIWLRTNVSESTDLSTTQLVQMKMITYDLEKTVILIIY